MSRRYRERVARGRLRAGPADLQIINNGVYRGFITNIPTTANTALLFIGMF